MFDNRCLRILIGIADRSQLCRKFCTCSVLLKRDKYSLKNIGSKKIKSSGGRKKAPSYKKYGGSKDFPVTLFQLPKLASNEFKLQKGSRHKLMIENALQIAIESLIFSGNISHTFSGCPLEITKVELVPSFSSAAVFWRLSSANGGPTVEDISKAFDENIEFIRSMLPAYHTMTNTPLITFHQDLTIERSNELDEALNSVDKKS